MRHVVGGCTRCSLVNRVYKSICHLQNGSESARPEGGFSRWCPDEGVKERLFVLVYLWVGCDFIPVVSKLPFLKMWKFAPESVRSPSIFAKPIFVQESGMWIVDLSEGVELWLRRASFRTKQRSFELKENHRARPFPTTVTSNSTSERSRLFVFKLGKGKPTNCCLPCETLIKHVRRIRSVFHLWQGELEDKTPRLEFKGEG